MADNLNAIIINLVNKKLDQIEQSLTPGMRTFELKLADCIPDILKDFPGTNIQDILDQVSACLVSEGFQVLKKHSSYELKEMYKEFFW